jgi:hypothetical protein
MYEWLVPLSVSEEKTELSPPVVDEKAAQKKPVENQAVTLLGGNVFFYKNMREIKDFLEITVLFLFSIYLLKLIFRNE